MSGPNDELKIILDKLKRLQAKETLCGVIESLKISHATHNLILNQEDARILAWLNSTDVSPNHQLARKKHEPTTGDWFLTSNDFSNWMKATNSTLWLHGKPGAGKTILCSTIINAVIEMCDSNPPDKIAYFYFDFNSNRTVVDMMRCITAQICYRTKTVPQELHNLYSQCNGGQPHPINLFRIFSSLLTNSHRTFVILDALDECKAGTDRQELLDQIKEMINLSSKHLNILVTSRREKDIEDKLMPVITTRIPLEDSDVDSDIALHIRNCLKTDDELQWGDDTKKQIEEVLCKKANGMYVTLYFYIWLMDNRFRWVECQLKTLRDCNTPQQVMETLAELPKDLDATYDRILTNIREKDREIARTVLRLIAVAYRPLTIEEMYEALTIDCEKEDINENKKLKNALALLKICSSLVELSYVFYLKQH